MKKYLFILLLTIAGYGQTLQNPTFGTITTKTAPTVITTPHLAAISATGVVGKIAPTSDILTNESTVTGLTTTDALNNLKNSIPATYTNIVYVNNTNPNSATIFDDVNPPITNDNSLKANASNLYVGTDSSGWVYNSTSLTYTSKAIPESSNFYLAGTTTDAGSSKTANIERTGVVKLQSLIADRIGLGGSYGSTIKMRLLGNISGGTIATGTLDESVVQSDVTSYAYYNRTFAGTQAAVFTLPNLTHYTASQNTFGAGSSVTNQTGFHVTNTLIGATGNYGFRSEIPSTATNYNLYMDGTAQNYINGNVGIKTSSPLGALDIYTGLSTMYPSFLSVPYGTISFGNLSVSNTVPTIYSKSNTSIGLSFMVGANDINTEDLRFDVREQNNTDFETLTSVAYKFRRFNTTLFDILRNGNASLPLGNLSTIAGTTANHVVIKSQLDLKADLASPALTGNPTAPTPTAGDNDTSIATTAFVTGAIATAKPYKVYTALISQTGTSAPTVIVLENTLGGTPVWSRIGPGVYSGLLSGFFTANKTTVIFTKQYTVPTGGTDIFTAAGCGSINSIDLSTANTAGLVDGVLSKATIEVRVYN